MLESLKNVVKENFDFKVNSHLSRGEAFSKDKTIYADQNGEDWEVLGDVSGFCYKSFTDKDKAEAYAAELNNNLKNSMKYV